VLDVRRAAAKFLFVVVVTVASKIDDRLRLLKTGLDYSGSRTATHQPCWVMGVNRQTA